MPQFDAATFSSQIFWLVVIFFGLLLVCHRVYFPKLAGILKERATKLQDERTRLEALRKDISNLEAARKEKTRATWQKIDTMLQQAEEEAKTKLQKQVQSLDMEILQTVQEVQDSLERQQATLQGTLQEVVDSCVKTAVEQLVSSLMSQENVQSSGGKGHVN
jgi:F-type H+-transporting ATPase subunit b